MPAARKTAKPKDGKKKKAARYDPLSIPRSVGKRYLRRSGCIRVGDDPTVPLNEIYNRKVLEVMSNAVRMAQLEGRRRVMTRDMTRALTISNIRIY
jgi:histone H3/H4